MLVGGELPVAFAVLVEPVPGQPPRNQRLRCVLPRGSLWLVAVGVCLFFGAAPAPVFLCPRGAARRRLARFRTRGNHRVLGLALRAL